MKTEEQIREKIAILEAERLEWVHKQLSHRWSREETENGSDTYGYYQDRDMSLARSINMLNWVLNK